MTSTAPAPSTDSLAGVSVPPSPGRFSDPAAAGRLAALRTFTDSLTSMDGRDDYETKVRSVFYGGAPEAFRSAYMATLRELHTIFSPTNRPNLTTDVN